MTEADKMPPTNETLRALTSKLAERLLEQMKLTRAVRVQFLPGTHREPETVDELLFAGLVELIGRAGYDWMYVLDPERAEALRRIRSGFQAAADTATDAEALALLGIKP